MLEKSREKAIYMKRQMASEVDTLRKCHIVSASSISDSLDSIIRVSKHKPYPGTYACTI